MSTWKEYKLGQTLDLIGGGTPKTSIASYWNGDIPWLSVVDFNKGMKYVADTEKKITEEGLSNSSTKLLNAGDIIISARGTVGVLAVLSKPMTFNQSCYGIRAKQDIVKQDYLYYLLNHCVRDLHQIAHGGVFDTITRETFDSIDVSIPSSPTEQQAIASILSNLDDKIDLLHRQNKTLEQLAETLFRQWFVEEAEEGTAVLRNYVESANTGLDAIKRAPIVEKDTGIRCLRIQDISQAKDLSRWGFSEVEDHNFRKFQLKRDDIIMARTCSPGINYYVREDVIVNSRGTCSPGINYYVREDLPAVFNNGLVRIRANQKVYPILLYYLFKTKEFIGHIDGISGGTSVQLNMQVGDLLDYSFSFPSIEKQSKVLDSFLDIDNKIFHNQKQIRTLTQLRDTLLPKLMSGEVRVKM